MQFVSGVVVFIIIWWVVIFCVLPFGVARTYNEKDHVDDEGYTAPGSPPTLNIKKKLMITTLISVVLWIIIYFIIDAGIIDFRELARSEDI